MYKKYCVDDLILVSITSAQVVFLSRSFTAQNVSKGLKNMAENRSPDPDGIASEFFLSTWYIVGDRCS